MCPSPSATSRTPAGALEIYLPYDPISDAIERDTTRLYLLLFAGLGLLWATLFRIVHGASRRLDRQAIDNEHQALHDALTDLPNRTLFHDRAQQAVIAASRSGTHVAVMLMDLDRFKEINDTLGHHSGDLLLREIGPRLRAALRTNDTVARLGGDEFARAAPVGAQRRVRRRRRREAAAMPCRSRSRSMASPSRPKRASVSPSHLITATMRRRCSSAPTSRCTSPSGRTPASRCTRRSTTGTAADACALVGDLRRAIAAGELLAALPADRRPPHGRGACGRGPVALAPSPARRGGPR